jgi:CheY-like chemotaxis protein
MDALEFLKEHEANPGDLPDLIFLDINMPIMNGFDFLNEYQNLSETIQKHCIIMMLTTSLNEDDRKRAIENKFVYSFMNKPLDKEKLDTIERQL